MYRTLSSVLMFLFTIGMCNAQETLINLTTLVQEQISQLPEGTEVSIGIMDQNRVIKVGYRVKEDQLEKLKNDDRLFEIGSITKTFTAAMIMKLQEEEMLELTDPIQYHLPVSMANDSFQNQTITIEHLITHTSGLSQGPRSFIWPYIMAQIFTPRNPNKFFKAKHYYSYLKKFVLNYVPGETWNYNNANYGLLGEIVSDKTTLSWESAVKENLFNPLGMTLSCFEINNKTKSNLVEGITAKGKKSRPWEMRFINPAGAIKSTVNDMLKYAEAQLFPPTVDFNYLLKTQNTLDYSIKMPEDKLWAGNAMGHGWWFNLKDKDNIYAWHGGASGGYTSFVGFSHHKNRAVVILSNISSNHPEARAENRIPIPIELGHQIMRMQGF